MGPKFEPHALLGCLAVAAALLLSWPGVEAVRANDDAPQSVDPQLIQAPVCSAESSPAPPVGEVLAQVHSSARAQQPGPHPVVTLNGAGYDEGPPPDVALDLIRVQLEQLRQ